MAEFGEGKKKQTIMERFRWGSKVSATYSSGLLDNSEHHPHL